MAIENQEHSDGAVEDESTVGIEVTDLRKTFANGDIVANNDINLSVKEGEFLVFLGPSGCGKTTALRCIAGLNTPDSGQILIQGEEVTYEPPRNRDLAFVFQSIALFPHMTVRENIQFGLDMEDELSKEEKQERVEEVTELLGLEGMLDRKPSELSGGQQQRVSLGRAMVMEPAAFLLDEPFSALDANLRDQMRTEVKKLQRELNTAMVFVTHDQEEAMSLGDQIVILDGGEIQQIGTPYEIYNNPENKFVADFIGSPSTNSIPSTVRRNGDDIIISNDIFEIELSDDQKERINLNSGEEIIIGIRPQYLTITEEDPLFEANLTVVEPHGDHDALFLESNGREITATTTQGKVDRKMNSVGIDIDVTDIWLFDKSGERLL